MLKQSLDVIVTKVRDEIRIDEHVDISVLDHNTSSWDVITELDVDPAQDASKERFIEHHPQDVRTQVSLILNSTGWFSHSLSFP